MLNRGCLVYFNRHNTKQRSTVVAGTFFHGCLSLVLAVLDWSFFANHAPCLPHVCCCLAIALALGVGALFFTAVFPATFGALAKSAPSNTTSIGGMSPVVGCFAFQIAACIVLGVGRFFFAYRPHLVNHDEEFEVSAESTKGLSCCGLVRQELFWMTAVAGFCGVGVGGSFGALIGTIDADYVVADAVDTLAENLTLVFLSAQVRICVAHLVSEFHSSKFEQVNYGSLFLLTKLGMRSVRLLDFWLPQSGIFTQLCSLRYVVNRSTTSRMMLLANFLRKNSSVTGSRIFWCAAKFFSC